MASPIKKKIRRSLNQGEALEIIRKFKRDLRKAAESIAYEEFMNVPVGDIPTKDLEEMEVTIGKLRRKIGEFM